MLKKCDYMVYQQNMTAAQLVNTRNAVGIINISGAVILAISLAFLEDFTENVVIWFLALFVGLIFYYKAGDFLKQPNQAILSSLRQIMYAFIVIWAAAIVVTVAIYETVYVDTFLGIIIVLVATYTMNQFISNGGLLLNAPHQATGQVGIGMAPQAQPGDKITQLERLSNLRDKGALSEEEYQKEKALVMQKYS